MITEIAIFNALPGKEDELGQAILKGIEVIRQHPECISARVERCIEQHPGNTCSSINGPLTMHIWKIFVEGLSFRNGAVISMAYLKDQL